MKLKASYLLIYFTVFFFNSSFSQESIANQEGWEIINSNSSKFPKFFRELQYIRKTESRIKGFAFKRGNTMGSPASASRNGIIKLDVAFLENTPDSYDDNRLVVVLYHELGHLYYFTDNTGENNREDNEKFAFEFSLKRTKNLAEMGDCEPLKTGLKFMQQRSLSNNLQDEHVRALKRMMNGPIINSYLSFVATNCQ